MLKRRARRRLVGAIAAVVFVVVVLPLVLDQEQKPVTQALTVQIPSPTESPFRSAPPPVMPSTTVEKPTATDKPVASSPEAVASPPAPAKATSRESSKPRPKDLPKETRAEAKRAAALLNDQAYFVPLGAFANPENAKQVQDKADGAGYRSYTEKVRGPQGEQVRVRAGPFPNREAAEKARTGLKSAGLDVGPVAQR